MQTHYPAGGSPGHNLQRDPLEFAVENQLLNVLRAHGHKSTQISYLGMGYQENYMCSTYQINGLEESRENINHVLQPLLQGGKVITESRGGAKVYIPRFRKAGSSATLASLVILTFCVFLLLAAFYLMLHYVDPVNFYLPERLDPF